MLPIYFAPLQGYTDAAYRNAHSELFGGISEYYSPFLRVEHGDIRRRDIRELEPSDNTIDNLVPQIIASSADEVEMLIEPISRLNYKRVDINMGCPFPMQVKRGRGAGILAKADKIKEVLDAAHKHNDISFSVKMRLGWESADESVNIAPLLNDYPLKSITMHARLGVQQYKGECDMTAFEKFVSVCKHKLIYNGDITTREQIENLAEKMPNIAGVMIGRGLLANPFLAIDYANGSDTAERKLYDTVKTMHQRLFKRFSAHLSDETQVLRRMQSFWEYLLPEADKKLKKKIAKTSSLGKYCEYSGELLR